MTWPDSSRSRAGQRALAARRRPRAGLAARWLGASLGRGSFHGRPHGRLGLALVEKRREAAHHRREGGGDVEGIHGTLAGVVRDRSAIALGRLVRERGGDLGVELGGALHVEVAYRRQLHGRDRLSRGSLDHAQHRALAGRHEHDRLAAAPRPAGAADAVHVRLGIVGHVEVDDVAETIEIEAARRHVGRHQDVDLAALERGDGALALRLLDVAIERGHAESPSAQVLGEIDGRLLGVGEDQHRVEALDLQDAGEGVELVDPGHQPVALADVGRGGGLGGDRDLVRIAQVLLGDAPDRRRHRRGEERDLLLERSHAEDRVDGVDEAHLQHLVGFVEDREAHVVEDERAALEVIHDSSRRADHHVHAATQRPELRTVALAAVDRQHPEILQVRRVGVERLGDLDRQLARGNQHQHLRIALTEIEARQDRQREGGRLARAGLRLPDEVAPLEQVRDRGELDRRGCLVADVLEGGEDGRREAEIGERSRRGWFG